MQATSGPMRQVVEKLSHIIAFDHLPFGNSYYATSECGGGPYDSDVRHCWAKRCVASAAPADDCFGGANDTVAQHGAKEYAVDRRMACAKRQTLAALPNVSKYWSFVVCMEADYQLLGPLATGLCAKKAGIDAERLRECYESAEGDEAVRGVAERTVDHAGTPWVLVDGKSVDVLGEPGAAVKAVCDAYTGWPVPAACNSTDAPLAVATPSAAPGLCV